MRPLTGKDRIWLAWWILTKKDVNWMTELKVDPELQRPLDKEKLAYWAKLRPWREDDAKEKPEA